MTAKEEGLWTPYGRVTAEDVKHMQSRVELFRCVQQVSGTRLTDSCAQRMCRWIVDGVAALDVASETGGYYLDSWEMGTGRGAKTRVLALG